MKPDPTRGERMGATRKRLSQSSARAFALDKARRMYVLQQKSIRDIAAELNVSYGTAHRLVKETGVQMRPRGGAYGKRKGNNKRKWSVG